VLDTVAVTPVGGRASIRRAEGRARRRRRVIATVSVVLVALLAVCLWQAYRQARAISPSAPRGVIVRVDGAA